MNLESIIIWRTQFTEVQNLTNFWEYFNTFKIQTKIMLEIKFEIDL